MPRRNGRFHRLDALRGVAIVWMTAFHFAFDLAYFGWLKADFPRDLVWTSQRAAIVSLFLFCAGLSQAVATGQGQSAARFWRRWWQIAGCAGLVTAGSWFMFPNSFIYFGVLHGIALMLIVVRFTAGAGRWLWMLAATAIAMKFIAVEAHNTWATLGFLNEKAFSVLGLINRKPATEDYVPVLPWLGVMWLGVASGQWVLRHRPAWFEAGARLGAASRGLSWLGRHSLAWYVLHQPVLIGLVWASTRLTRP